MSKKQVTVQKFVKVQTKFRLNTLLIFYFVFILHPSHTKYQSEDGNLEMNEYILAVMTAIWHTLNLILQKNVYKRPKNWHWLLLHI